MYKFLLQTVLYFFEPVKIHIFCYLCTMKAKVRREHKKTLLFNDAEMVAIQSFCKKYKITNQAKFFREAIITTILQKTEEDHPKLF